MRPLQETDFKIQEKGSRRIKCEWDQSRIEPVRSDVGRDCGKRRNK